MTPVAEERTAAFLDTLGEAFRDGSLIRLKLGGYHGSDEALKSAEGRKVALKGGDKLSIVWRYKTRDITKNYGVDEAVALLRAWLADDFRSARLSTTGFDLSFERNGDKVRLKRETVEGRATASGAHDRAKDRPVVAEKPWLNALGLTDTQGNVLNAAQDKFRQINRMVEIFAPLIQAIPKERLTRIVDMGAGKGYLTFALYDHLATALGLEVEMVGVEVRKSLVELCNGIAAENGFSRLRFVEGSILDYDAAGASAVIALHACDTATDDAISRGIAAGAELIAVAPCCHKQIRREMEAGKAADDLDFLLRHGVFLERQAEMVTDGLRALMLELSSYRTRVFEFVPDAHTPKNVLIVAQKDRRAGRDREAVLGKIAATKARFGIGRHQLETLLGL
ncbi:class I SAM-dependent methyltransferase [Devosia nitrariae]|uniref:Methyltransferase n=1 Tax=Devosia nitrariae TaxID=2071872 RepID=A0ABQ5W3I6_9HYPH|nr:SAM-dependent methyltransferase [Devosia nitrariae]GLQ54632.1 methyltransferase [Devosia nitrariae]